MIDKVKLASDITDGIVRAISDAVLNAAIHDLAEELGLGPGLPEPTVTVERNEARGEVTIRVARGDQVRTKTLSQKDLIYGDSEL